MPNLGCRTGVAYPALADPAGLPEFARRVEALGFDTLWVIEDCFLSGALTLAATALATTTSLTVGVGLLPVPGRNPAIAAMEIGTVARIHPGRFEVAFGHGVAAWMRQIGALPARRLDALRETTAAIRALLAGDVVTMSGTHVTLEQVALNSPPQIPPPVLIGTTGPRGLAVANESADGILLPEGCGPAFIEWATGQQSATRTCVVYSWFSIDDDPVRARRRLQPSIDRWLDADLYPHPRRAAGVSKPPPAGDPARSSLADSISVCGDRQACAAAIRRLTEAGATTVVLFADHTDDLTPQLERFAHEVMPFTADSPSAC